MRWVDPEGHDPCGTPTPGGACSAVGSGGGAGSSGGGAGSSGGRSAGQRFWDWLTKPFRGKTNSNPAYEAARQGGRQSGYYQNSLKMTTAQINRALKKLDNHIAEHYDKLANPAKYAERWTTMTRQEQEGLLNYWRKEIVSKTEQRDILRGILQERARNIP